MLIEQEIATKIERMLMARGTLAAASVSISGHPDGAYSVTLNPLPPRSFPNASLAAQGVQKLAEQRVDALIRAGAISRADRPKAAYEASTWLFPSLNIDDYWIWANLDVGEYPEHTERGGKWMLFMPASDVDEHWSRVIQAFDAGSLGNSAKVATARKNPTAPNAKERVICVYTYDADDYADVSRIRQALREIGYTRKLAYKMDETTMAGRYSKDGRVSRYYE